METGTAWRWKPCAEFSRGLQAHRLWPAPGPPPVAAPRAHARWVQDARPGFLWEPVTRAVTCRHRASPVHTYSQGQRRGRRALILSCTGLFFLSYSGELSPGSLGVQVQHARVPWKPWPSLGAADGQAPDPGPEASGDNCKKVDLSRQLPNWNPGLRCGKLWQSMVTGRKLSFLFTTSTALGIEF